MTRRVAVALAILVLGALPALAATITVPGDQPTIQDAITAASAGDIIAVDAGTYQEQLYIDKTVDLVGAGAGVCTIEAPDAVDRSTYTVTQWNGAVRTVDAVVGVNGAGTVNISGFTVDGRDTGPDNFYGIHYFDTSGAITACTVSGITYPAAPGAQRVVSIVAAHSDGTPIVVDVSGNQLPDFQKGGILVMGPDCSFTVNGNTVMDVATGDIAGNGIQLAYGASGSTAGNVVQGVGYTGSSWAGTGILLFESGDVSMDGDEVFDCQSGVNYSDWRWVYSHPVPVNIQMDSLNLHDNEWSLGAQLSGDESDLNIDITGCTITGSAADGLDLFGTDAWTGYYTGWQNGDLVATVTDCVVSGTAAGYDGLWTGDFSGNTNNASVTVRNTSFVDNGNSGINNDFPTAAVDARECFWNSATGPVDGGPAPLLPRATRPRVAPIGVDLPRNAPVVEVLAEAGDRAAETFFGSVMVSPFLALPPGTTPMTWGVAPGATIQAAIDAAAPLDVIDVAAGTYPEQLHITTDDLTITGAGAGLTIVQAFAGMPAFFTTGAYDNYPLVFVDGATGAALSALTLDGAGLGNSNNRFVGLGFWNGGGSLSDAEVLNVMDTPFSGTQHGVGVYSANDTGGPYTIALSNVQVLDFQKTGVALTGAGLTVDLDDVTTVGQGPTNVTAQNGIQISGGAGGTVDNCAISDIAWTGGTWTATGFLLDGAATVTASGVDIDNCQTSVYWIDTDGSYGDATISNPIGDAYYAYSTAPDRASGQVKVLPQPVEGLDFASGDRASVTATVSNCVVTGTGLTDSWGVSAFSDLDGPIDFTVTGCTITNWDWGVVVYDFDATLDPVITSQIHGNTISGNTSYGAFAYTANAQDATDNWWGAASGPYHPTLNPLGLGNAVSDNVAFEPYAGQVVFGIAASDNGPMNCSESSALTFSYTPDALTPAMRGYSLRIPITAAATFDSTSFVPNPALYPTGPGSAPSFFDVSLAPGGTAYTVDYSILGTTPGILAPVNLFTLTVDGATDGTAVIGADSCSVRDLSNQPIGADCSASQSIVVDCTSPASVTGITAAPGHQKVELSWTNPGDADLAGTEIWRALSHDAGLASTYPEYGSEAGNIEPTRPADRDGADASAEWTLVHTALAGETSWTDPVADRGIYYYELFAVDTASNIGPLAPANDRATNYWLGDVNPTVTGDGDVDLVDITVLGAAYGTASGGLGYDNTCDVGPTDSALGDGIPLPDNLVGFEDLMIFAQNYDNVAPRPVQGSDIALLSWFRQEDGAWALALTEPCANLKALRLGASLPDGVSATVSEGSLLGQQAGPVFLRQLDGESLDVSLALMGRGLAVAGRGVLFTVRLEGDAQPVDLELTVRDTRNAALDFTLSDTSVAELPSSYRLVGNFPNPFNPKTSIAFDLPEAQFVSLSVFSADGRLIRTLVDRRMDAGHQVVTWAGRDANGAPVASGIYFARIEAGPLAATHKMLLMK